MDEVLRRMIAQLTGSNLEAWIIFEGQSTDWLVQNSLVVLDQATLRWRYESNRGDEYRKCLKETDKLRNDRNLVIHGDWATTNRLSSPAKPRSTDAAHAAETFFVMRSRYRRWGHEECWSAADVDAVASAIQDWITRVIVILDEDQEL
ncbi:hypothetical protein [Nocardia sp. NPDC005825]|uniref:hypothetical protein n=1 Tax=unclassified Nocardia TaxID=2637762 RepID=UPI0033E60889